MSCRMMWRIACILVGVVCLVVDGSVMPSWAKDHGKGSNTESPEEVEKFAKAMAEKHYSRQSESGRGRGKFRQGQEGGSPRGPHTPKDAEHVETQEAWEGTADNEDRCRLNMQQMQDKLIRNVVMGVTKILSEKGFQSCGCNGMNGYPMGPWSTGFVGCPYTGMGWHYGGMGQHMSGMGQNMGGMGQNMGGMGQNMDGIGQHMDGMGQHMGGMGQHMGGMGQHMGGMGQNMGGMGQHMGGMGEHMGGMKPHRGAKQYPSPDKTQNIDQGGLSYDNIMELAEKYASMFSGMDDVQDLFGSMADFGFSEMHNPLDEFQAMFSHLLDKLTAEEQSFVSLITQYLDSHQHEHASLNLSEMTSKVMDFVKPLIAEDQKDDFEKFWQNQIAQGESSVAYVYAKFIKDAFDYDSVF
ncbi:hypothetical protein CAPTEDRAFT_191285 [Capitella teleta]|uniref:SXP/RAL-2 family protein Ani s 5-like cation-binding domain-containing protein n=1 Tax=Capitella teleta TaxID=283909 RepID=R7UF09_CAPTE|nr:hypothetical protein CAPTEDRAFT_191285 [Capitella teleta]|eukprot:ELU01862.1 hypothetical protein CAPTEDRAFT_191285 [Capitella teleta]